MLSKDCARLVMVGDEGVGKSALAVRLLTHRFIGEYQNNQEMLYKKQFITDDVSGAHVKLELLDTLGTQIDDTESNNPAVERLHWSAGIVIVYSVTDSDSFKQAKQIIKAIKREKPSKPCLLIGNKSDLTHLRVVSEQDGRNAVLPYGRCMFAEVSAATEQVSESFLSFIKDTVQTNRRKSVPVKRRKSIVNGLKAFGTMLKHKSSQSVDK